MDKPQTPAWSCYLPCQVRFSSSIFTVYLECLILSHLEALSYWFNAECLPAILLSPVSTLLTNPLLCFNSHSQFFSPISASLKTGSILYPDQHADLINSTFLIMPGTMGAALGKSPEISLQHHTKSDFRAFIPSIWEAESSLVDTGSFRPGGVTK